MVCLHVHWSTISVVVSAASRRQLSILVLNTLHSHARRYIFMHVIELFKTAQKIFLLLGFKTGTGTYQNVHQWLQKRKENEFLSYFCNPFKTSVLYILPPQGRLTQTSAFCLPHKNHVHALSDCYIMSKTLLQLLLLVPHCMLSKEHFLYLLFLIILDYTANLISLYLWEIHCMFVTQNLFLIIIFYLMI